MIRQKIRVLSNPLTGLFVFDSYGLFNNMNLILLSTPLAWVTVNTGFDGYVTYLDIDPTTSSITSGTYTLNFSLGNTSPPGIDAVLEIEVLESFTDSLTTCNNSEAICIVWITREGGRASYIFDQRKNFGVVIGENKTYDNGGIVKYTYRGKNFDTKTVYKTGISDNEVDLIESLRYSIQAWEYNADTDVSTPIILDSNSFDKYNTKSNFNEISFKYRIGAYKTIQSQ